MCIHTFHTSHHIIIKHTHTSHTSHMYTPKRKQTHPPHTHTFTCLFAKQKQKNYKKQKSTTKNQKYQNILDDGNDEKLTIEAREK